MTTELEGQHRGAVPENVGKGMGLKSTSSGDPRDIVAAFLREWALDKSGSCYKRSRVRERIFVEKV